MVDRPSSGIDAVSAVVLVAGAGGRCFGSRCLPAPPARYQGAAPAAGRRGSGRGTLSVQPAADKRDPYRLLQRAAGRRERIGCQPSG